jgi:hypothetical protein
VSSLDLCGLVSALRSLNGDRFRPENIGRLLVDVRFGSAGVGNYIHFARGRYLRNLVYACDDFEVAVLCWDRDAASPIHDHAGQHCWFTTLEGSFDVEDYRRVSGGFQEGHARVERTGLSQCVYDGSPDYRHGENEVHRVAVSPGWDRAISLHIYSKPLASCLIFDDKAQRCVRKTLTYDTRPTNRLELVDRSANCVR